MLPLLPPQIRTLIEEFSKLPGIGNKSAERLTFFLLRSSKAAPETLSRALHNLKEGIRFCRTCQMVSVEEECPVCATKSRDHSMILVVEEPLDVIAIERTGSFMGLYHVLGGLLESGKNDNSQNLRIPELLHRVEDEGIEEVILATNPTTEGDLTALYLKKKLEPSGVRTTRIARGLSTGGDIEYADELTLTSALTNRKDLV